MTMMEATTTIDLGGEANTTTVATDETSIDQIHIETIEERFDYIFSTFFYSQ